MFKCVVSFTYILAIVYKAHKYIKFFDAYIVIDHEFFRLIFVGVTGNAINATFISAVVNIDSFMYISVI